MEGRRGGYRCVCHELSGLMEGEGDGRRGVVWWGSGRVMGCGLICGRVSFLYRASFVRMEDGPG